MLPCCTYGYLSIKFLNNNVGQSGLLNIYIDLAYGTFISYQCTTQKLAAKVSSNQITESTACETIPRRRHPIRQLDILAYGKFKSFNRSQYQIQLPSWYIKLLPKNHPWKASSSTIKISSKHRSTIFKARQRDPDNVLCSHHLKSSSLKLQIESSMNLLLFWLWIGPVSDNLVRCHAGLTLT